ncbi:MAG: tetratricopeptide repeat protein [Verrucomicrobia bacterium]|nr:tetratricopeptide repeat protein [Verrucomicrobiota bacterium]
MARRAETTASPLVKDAIAQTWAVGLLLAVTLIAYANSLLGPLVFDDVDAIVNNDSLASLGAALHPPSHRTVSGRPVANVTFALNRLAGGVDPIGYHAVNLLIHLGAALTLFGLVRRTLLLPPLAAKFGAASRPLALAVAALWAVHPLQTEAVTYIVQRVESLMGLFYLFTLYAFVRGATGPAPSSRWLVGSVAACLLGMGTKEVMVSAPLLVLSYDALFVAGGWAAAWRARRWYYVALAATWLWLGWLVWQAGQRDGSAGFGPDLPAWHYALTQCRAVVHYLRLALWPQPLVFDYGMALVRDPAAVLPQALLLLALGAATLFSVIKKHYIGFLGLWFFAILAPTSSLVRVITQTMAERRMYLPLAAVVTLLVLGAYAWLGRRSLAIWIVVALGWGGATLARNADYRTDVGLWRDTIAKLPTNPRAYDALGNVLADAGRADEAAEQFQAAQRVDPRYVEARNDLGVLRARQERLTEAMAAFEAALAIAPDFAAAHFNLANALVAAGRPAAAKPHYLAALRLHPGQSDVLWRLADSELAAGDFAAAAEHARAVVAVAPDFVPVRFSLALALERQGRAAEAIPEYETVLALDPAHAAARIHLAAARRQAEVGR